MIGDKNHREEISLQVKYSQEISEQSQKGEGLSEPVLGPEDFVKVKRWKIDRVFYFLAFISTVCMCALVISPTPVVQVVVISIWTSSAAFANHLLGGAYGRKR